VRSQKSIRSRRVRKVLWLHKDRPRPVAEFDAYSGDTDDAEVRFGTCQILPPSTSNTIDKTSEIWIDKRKKDDRSMIRTTKRKYEIEPYFIDRVVFHFLCGFIDRNYIVNLHYKPSTLPLFDGRLLSFFKKDDGIWKRIGRISPPMPICPLGMGRNTQMENIPLCGLFRRG